MREEREKQMHLIWGGELKGKAKNTQNRVKINAEKKHRRNKKEVWTDSRPRDLRQKSKFFYS